MFEYDNFDLLSFSFASGDENCVKVFGISLTIVFLSICANARIILFAHCLMFLHGI